MTTWGFSLSKNTSLYHIDLSYNEFNEIDLRLLVRALNKNSTMMGVHLEGNPGLHNFKINRNLRGQYDANEEIEEFLPHEKNNFILSRKIKDKPTSESDRSISSRFSSAIKKGLGIVPKLKATKECWMCQQHTKKVFQYTMPLNLTKKAPFHDKVIP